MTRPLCEIATLDDFLSEYGGMYARHVLETLQPLHVPDRDPLPDFGYVPAGRKPIPGQAHAIAGCVKMLSADRSGFLAAAPGGGKSLMGALIVHTHGCLPRRRGGRGGRYRALVFAPDHLIDKWRREIESTIPHARVRTFERWHEIIDVWEEVRGPDGHWRKPDGPEFYVLGRDQSKLGPKFLPIGEACLRRRPVTIERRDGPVMTEILACPHCGGHVLDRNGKIVAEITKQMTCEARILREVVSPEKATSGLDRQCYPSEGRTEPEGKVARIEGQDFDVRVCVCREPLWQYVRKPFNRWPPARFIHRKMKRGAFQYLIIDEAHEAKSDESGQSMAAGKLMACVDHVLGMTGTLIGGYAHHLFPLLFRMDPRALKDEGFEWGKWKEFARTYGCIDTIVRQTESREVSVGRSASSMIRSRSSPKPEERVAPGIMPSLYANHMLGRAVFMSLKDITEDLPPLHDNPPHAIEMDAELNSEYGRIQDDLMRECREMMVKGDTRLLGAMLHTLLEYPDKPYGWAPRYQGRLAIGYHDGEPCEENWKGVTQPADLNSETLRAKEERYLDLVSEYVRQGRQVWTYVQMSGLRDIQPRLAEILERHGIRAGVLRSNTVSRRQREEWIRKNGARYQVMISHPKLVETGLDLFLFAEKGGYNYSSLVFYQTGYNVFTLVQASLRAYRVIQTKECTIDYLYYGGTMQAQAMALIAKKRQASAAIDGDLSCEGLMAMAGAGDVSLGLARMINRKIDDGDIRRGWSRKLDAGTTNPTILAYPPAIATGFDRLAAIARLRERLARTEMQDQIISTALNAPPPTGERPEITDEIESLRARLERIKRLRGIA
jgi:hypothetical protein